MDIKRKVALPIRIVYLICSASNMDLYYSIVYYIFRARKFLVSWLKVNMNLQRKHEMGSEKKFLSPFMQPLLMVVVSK